MHVCSGGLRVLGFWVCIAALGFNDTEGEVGYKGSLGLKRYVLSHCRSLS